MARATDERSARFANALNSFQRPELASVKEIVAASVALGAGGFGGPLSKRERQLIEHLRCSSIPTDKITADIHSGLDPLGDAICAVRPPERRRKLGAFYTPRSIVCAMVGWALAHEPTRVVDPGCGSGRFAAEAIRRDTALRVVAIDVDPLATLACRATLAVLGAKHVRVVNGDYTGFHLESEVAQTAFVGNPPYVRHHELSHEQKAWAKEVGIQLGLSVSGLAGLHVLFFLAALRQARAGDVGCFITSAEWLDVGYGRVLREALLNGMGGLSLHLLDRESLTFEDAMTTAAITCFEVGRPARSVRIRHVRSAKDVGDLAGGQVVRRSRLVETPRWTQLFFPRSSKGKSGALVPLGEIVRVSRGVATEGNAFFILTKDRALELGLLNYTVPVLTRAKDVLTADGIVPQTATKFVLLAPPREINLSARQHASLRSYLAEGKRLGVTHAYLCRHRSQWWYLGAKKPPIVATYMTRQGPAFALNPERLAIVNVLHGLFPKVPLDEKQLLGLVRYLNAHRQQFRGSGRTYQGGLEKFEPREMEALAVPRPQMLHTYAGV